MIQYKLVRLLPVSLTSIGGTDMLDGQSTHACCAHAGDIPQANHAIRHRIGGC